MGDECHQLWDTGMIGQRPDSTERKKPSRKRVRTPGLLVAENYRDLSGHRAPIVTASELRRRPGATFAKVIDRGIVVITREGEPIAVMLSIEALLVTLLGLAEWRAGFGTATTQKQR